MANDTRDTIDLTLNADSRILALRAEKERQQDFARYEQAANEAQRVFIARELAQRWGLCA